jgi:hypothetical protein
MKRSRFRSSAVTVAVAGAVLGPLAVGLAAGASASPCDPATLAMTPQPQLSCAPPDGVPPPPADAAAAPAGPIQAPMAAAPPPVDPAAPPNGVQATGETLPDAFPAPGQAPFIPPVIDADGTQRFGNMGYLREIWHEFHNGVPADLLYGPPPPAPADPAAPPPPGAPLPPPPAP